MRFVDEYRDGTLARRITREIARLAPDGETVRIMEVCGGHTHAIAKHGLEDMLPAGVEYLHGPGCPVCVIPMGRVDDAISLAERPEIVFTTFGDMLRVPGGKAAGRYWRSAHADQQTREGRPSRPCGPSARAPRAEETG